MRFSYNVQLFQERLSEEVHATNPERYNLGGFEFTSCSSKKFERMAQETVDICLRMLKENNKSIDSTAIVSGTVY